MPSNWKGPTQCWAQLLHLGVYVDCIEFQVYLSYFFNTPNKQQLETEKKKERKGNKEGKNKGRKEIKKERKERKRGNEKKKEKKE